MDDEMKFAGIGAYLYGALYLTGVFALGVFTGNHAASLWAVAGAGAAYLTQVSVAFRIAGAIPAWLMVFLWLLTGVTGLIAGIVLLTGG